MAVGSAVSLPTSCELCPRRCGVNRAAGERGVCGAGSELRVARAALHAWEEPVVSVGAGSGTVFFSGCPLRCVYCQNAEISTGFAGVDIPLERLVEIFLELQDSRHAANINLVTPTHYAPWIVEAVRRAREKGLRVPVVYNSSGYETAEAVRALPLVPFWANEERRSELFAADYTIGKGEKITLDFDGENQRVITISDLNNSGRTEEGKKLSMEIASGVLRIFQRISAAMPDEVNQLMTLMTLVQ